VITFNKVLTTLGDIMPRPKKSTKPSISAQEVVSIVGDFLNLYKTTGQTEILSVEGLNTDHQAKILETLEQQSSVVKSRAVRRVAELFGD